jgi:hypothetical protein
MLTNVFIILTNMFIILTNLYSIFLVLSHVFGYLGQKLLGCDHEKVCFFLNLIFSPVRNFKFRHMFCRNKKFCSVKSRFLYICHNTNFGQYCLSTVYFWGDFNETFKLLFSHAHLQMCQVSLKTSKNKICHFWQAPLAATGPLWNIWRVAGTTRKVMQRSKQLEAWEGKDLDFKMKPTDTCRDTGPPLRPRNHGNIWRKTWTIQSVW